MTYDELMAYYRPSGMGVGGGVEDQNFNMAQAAGQTYVPGVGMVSFTPSNYGAGPVVPGMQVVPGNETAGTYTFTRGPNGELQKTFSPYAPNKDWTNSVLGPMAALGIPALASTLGAGALGGQSAGWTSGYDLAGGGAITPSATSGGMVLPGADQGFWEVGSNGMGGMSGGNTVGDAIAGGGASSLGFYGGDYVNTAGQALASAAQSPAAQSAVSKILSGQGGMQDWLSLLGPAMSIGSGLYGLDKAKDLTGLVDSNVGDVMGRLGGLGINPAAVATDRGAQARAAIAGADPWTASGGRALADAQLQALMRSPGSLLTDPGYQARMMGVDRVMAAQGQLGGGGGAVAAANASGDYYQQRLNALAQLENMGNPVGAQQVGLGQEQLGVQQGQLGLDTERAKANLGLQQAGIGLDAAKLKLAAAQSANTLAGQSLASIGYGVTQGTGGMTSIPQAVTQWLRSQGALV